MSALTSRTTRLAAAAVAGLWITTTSGGAALAAGAGGVDVVNTETVQVYLDSSGKVDSKRVYEQIDLTGHGKVALRNPVETKGLRNLDGFSGFKVVDHEQVVTTDVDGSRRLRSVSDYTGDLPLKVAISYKLDGKPVKPGDVVGRSGELAVQFDVENVTSKKQEVSYADGKGGTVTKTVDVPLPIVGSLTTTAPANFTHVESDQANVAGDGEGGTKLSFTMTLFPPIGSTKASFGYTADITDGVVPEVEISALPVNPLESPTFKSAAASYQGGADTGSELTAGASEIDSNLLKLRDGAADLLAGLIKLHDGADQLSDGLTADAAPGARKLAAGADKLADGLGQLDDGAGQLADGTGQLDAGAKKLRAGAGQLAKGAGDAATGSRSLTDGLKQINGGLSQLADGTTGLPAAKTGIQQLQGGIGLLLTGLGDPTDEKSLIGGLSKLGTSLSDAQTGAGQLAGGLQLLAADSGLPAAQKGVDQVQSSLAGAAKDGGLYDQLAGALTSFKPLCAAAPDPDTCRATFDGLIKGAQGGKASAQAGADGLAAVSNGLGKAIGSLTTLLIPGAQKLDAGLGAAALGAGKLQGGAEELKGGTVKIRDGLAALSVGVTKAVSGVMQLSSGSSTAYTGSAALSNGLGKLEAGAGDLYAGTGDLADGTGDLRAGARKLADGADDASAGSGQLADGAGKLADGLGDAADGSQQLADGLGTAVDGAPQLVDGSERLSTEGTKKLVAAGESTAQSYGEMVAVMDAGAKRAQTEDMAYGAPEDALGLTAYSFVIKGEDGEGGRNLARGLGAGVLLAGGAGVFALRRRFV